MLQQLIVILIVVAAALWRLSSIAVAAIGVGSALAGFSLRWYVLERELDGLTTGWLTDPAGTPLGLVIDVFVRVSLIGIEILTVDARIVIASVDTYLRFA